MIIKILPLAQRSSPSRDEIRGVKRVFFIMDNFLPFYRSPLCVVLLFFNGCGKSSDSPQNEMKVRQGDGEGCSLGSVAVS